MDALIEKYANLTDRRALTMEELRTDHRAILDWFFDPDRSLNSPITAQEKRLIQIAGYIIKLQSELKDNIDQPAT